MGSPASVLLVIAAVFACANWGARARGSVRAERLTKPAAITALIGVAVALEPADAAQRAWFVAALVLSAVGDVALLPPRERFAAGLGAFLLAHVAYVTGFVTAGVSGPAVLVGGAVVAVLCLAGGGRVLTAVRAGGEPGLTVPVGVYIVVLAAMVTAAVGHGRVVAVVGALAFLVSDGMIAWNRFVRRLPGAPVAIMVTYHVGQAALVLSLLR